MKLLPKNMYSMKLQHLPIFYIKKDENWIWRSKKFERTQIDKFEKLNIPNENHLTD